MFSQIAKTSRNRNSLPSIQWWVLTRWSWPVEASVLLYSTQPGPSRFLSCFFTSPPTPSPASEPLCLGPWCIITRPTYVNSHSKFIREAAKQTLLFDIDRRPVLVDYSLRWFPFVSLFFFETGKVQIPQCLPNRKQTSIHVIYIMKLRRHHNTTPPTLTARSLGGPGEFKPSLTTHKLSEHCFITFRFCDFDDLLLINMTSPWQEDVAPAVKHG